MADSTRSIFASARSFFSGTVLSRITGLLRDMAMAWVFGTGEAIAAFMVAFRFSHTPRRLLGEGALQSAFVPHFEELRKGAPERAFQFFRDLTASWLLLLVGIALFAMVGLWGAGAFFAVSADNLEILQLTALMIPSLIFICLYGLNTSLLQCEGVYFVPSVAPVAFNIVWIGAVVMIWWYGASSAMWWLSLGIIAACCGQWLMTIPQTRRIVRQGLQASSRWSPKPFSTDVRRLMKPLFLGIMGVAAAQINSAVDPVFARYADLSGPAYLWYAIRFQQLPIALFGVALSGALLPPLSRALKSGDRQQFCHFLEHAVVRTTGFMVPMMVALVVMGDSCLNLAYGRGDFGATSIVGSVQCLWGYAVGLIPMALLLVVAPAFYAQGDYRTPTIGAALSVVVNIVLNAYFIMGMGYGAESVAYATSISGWFNLLFLTRSLKKRMGVSYLTTAFYKQTAQVVVWTMLASVCAVAIGIAFFGDRAMWQIAMGEEVLLAQDFTVRLLSVFLKGFCFLVVCLPLVRKEYASTTYSEPS